MTTASRSPATADPLDDAPVISPGLLIALLAALAAAAVHFLNLTGELTLGIDLGTTYSVAATCGAKQVRVVEGGGGSNVRIGAGGGGEYGVGEGGATVPSVVHFSAASAPVHQTPTWVPLWAAQGWAAVGGFGGGAGGGFGLKPGKAADGRDIGGPAALAPAVGPPITSS